MSPSEHDLRAALHRGEGEPVDVDRVTATAAAAGAARRTRRLAVTASVVLVAAAAVTGTAVLTRGDDPRPPTAAEREGSVSSSAGIAAGAPVASPAGPAGSPAATGTSATAGTSSTTGGGGSTAAARCPASFPLRMLPGGGSPGQFGAGSPLFERTPVRITACGYSATGTLTGSTVLTGRDATALRTSLEAAPDAPAPCPTAPGRTGTQLAFVGVDAQGRTLRVVTTDSVPGYCNARTTNGTAVRFNWVAPASLKQTLLLLGASVLPTLTPSGRMTGSPVR